MKSELKEPHSGSGAARGAVSEASASTQTPSGASGVPPCWLDNLILAVVRPEVLTLTFAFLLTPTYLLNAALSSGAAFLKIDTGARPTAMGGAYTALADDVNALYYNPGGLAKLRHREMGATHAKWLLGTTFDFVGYAQPTEHGTFGIGITRLAVGNHEGRGRDRERTASFDASDTAYTIGYSRDFGHLSRWGRTRLGANLKYLQSRIGPYTANATAFDLGAHHDFNGGPLTLGLSVLNLGKGMTFLDQTDPLPLMVSLGAAYNVGGLFRVTTDVRHDVHDERMSFGFGTEYALMPRFTLRGGYTSYSAQSIGGSAGALGGFGGGFGLKLGNYRTDYTFTPFGALGNAQRLSIGARF